MSYRKLTTPMPHVHKALASALQSAGVSYTLADALLAAGTTVSLDDGTYVWLSCIANDDPATPFVEMLTVAIAGEPDMSGPRPWHNSYLYRAFQHAVPPAVVADIGLNAIRRELLLVALGEYERTDDGWLQLLPQAVNDRSIRVAIRAADEVSAPQEDVL